MIKAKQKKELSSIAEELDTTHRGAFEYLTGRLQTVLDDLEVRFGRKSDRWKEENADEAQEWENDITSLQSAIEHLSNAESYIDEAYGNITEVSGER